MTRIAVQFAGANDGGDAPTHVMGTADAVWHAGMRVTWVRWARYPGEPGVPPEYGPWERVIRERPDELGDTFTHA